VFLGRKQLEVLLLIVIFVLLSTANMVSCVWFGLTTHGFTGIRDEKVTPSSLSP
jgi:hypothetical protein